MIAVVLEGGLVSAVVTDNAELLGTGVVIIDYDTEGADEDEITAVVQPDGKTSDACVWFDDITQAGIEIPQYQERSSAP